MGSLILKLAAVLAASYCAVSMGEEGERFVPNNRSFSSAVTIDVRSEATVYGQEVRLKQVCRWSDGDGAVLNPVGDVVLMRLGTASPFRSVGIEEIKTALHDAGVNLASLNFSGALSCTVSRSDVRFDEGAALEKWIEKGSGFGVQGSVKESGAEQNGAEQKRVESGKESMGGRTLKEVLVGDLSARLGVGVEALQVAFSPQDERVLGLREAAFGFGIEPTRAKNLGTVSWDVAIKGAGATAKKVTISGVARAWQEQVVLARPVACKQIIRGEDVAESRVLVDRVGDQVLLKRGQVVGQQAAQEMKPGMVLVARTVNPVPLAQAGQLISVTVNRGGIQIQTVARAMEGGSYGQTIRAKNETTKDVLEVTLTGPQTGVMGSVGVASSQ